MTESPIYKQITVVLYNTASSIFQAVGNSKSSLYYLITSYIINVILDLLFVVVFKMGIAGAAVAGCGSYSRIEGFAFIQITSFALSMTTFIGQTLGSQKYERAKKGTYFGIATSTILAEIIGIIFFLAAPTLIALFSNDPQVI